MYLNYNNEFSDYFKTLHELDGQISHTVGLEIQYIDVVFGLRSYRTRSAQENSCVILSSIFFSYTIVNSTPNRRFYQFVFEVYKRA